MTRETRKFGVTTRFTFTLNVDYSECDKIIGCIPIVKSFQFTPPKQTTKITDILGSGACSNSCTFGFLDPDKKAKRWIVTMKDALRSTVLPPVLSSPMKCWWCHDHFTENPLGCPVKFNKEYYLTKGYFCSWECTMAFAEDVRSKPEFHESIQLLYHMFNASGCEGKITSAPHFSLKQEYGGPLTPEEYRGNHQHYHRTGNNYIYMVPVGELFEVVSKF